VTPKVGKKRGGRFKTKASQNRGVAWGGRGWGEKRGDREGGVPQKGLWGRGKHRPIKDWGGGGGWNEDHEMGGKKTPTIG